MNPSKRGCSMAYVVKPSCEISDTPRDNLIKPDLSEIASDKPW